jgi:hypothetical protein
VGETLFDRAARDGSLTAAGVLLRDYALRCWRCGARHQRAGRVEEPGARPAATGGERVHLHVSAAGHRPLPREFPHIERDGAPHAGSRIPEELSLRTFELGVISFKPDPAQFRTIAVYATAWRSS